MSRAESAPVSPPAPSPPTLRPLSPGVTATVVVLLCLIWGSTWIAIQWGFRSLPVFGSAALRFGIAFAAMAAVAPWLHRRETGDRPPTWLWVAQGSLNFGGSYGIVYWTESKLPSGIVAVLWSVFPLLMAVTAHVYIPGERLAPRSALGFVVGFAGVALLFVEDLAALGPEAIPAGAVLLLSPLVSAIGTALVKRHGTNVSSVLLNRNAMGLGAAMLAVAALATEGDATWTWDGAAVGSLLYLSLAGTCLTFGLYFWLLRQSSAARLSLIAYATPCVALLLGAILGGESYGLGTALGTVLVLSGIGLVRRS